MAFFKIKNNNNKVKISVFDLTRSRPLLWLAASSNVEGATKPRY